MTTTTPINANLIEVHLVCSPVTPIGSGSKLVKLTATPAPAELAEPPPPPQSQQSQPMETQDQSAPVRGQIMLNLQVVSEA